MGFEKDFLDLMAFTIKLAAPTGRNAQGKPTYAGAVDKEYRARISGPTQTLRRPQSELNSSLYTVWVDSGNDVISNEYRITLPNDAVWGPNLTPIMFSVSRVSDESGHHHTKITLGFMYHRQGQT